MKACRPDISRTLSGNYAGNFFELKIPAIVIIQERAKGYFDTVTLGNRVVGYSMELHKNTRWLGRIWNCIWEYKGTRYREFFLTQNVKTAEKL